MKQEVSDTERLKEELIIKEGALRGLTDLCRSKDHLILELCDALESISIVLRPPRELIRRAREATK